MTAPTMDTYTVPVQCGGMDSDNFPFDDPDDRRNQFQTELDDIATRYPEFAEHLNPIPRAPPRRSTAAHFTEVPRHPRRSEFRQFRERPFGSRFEEFGFPFTDNFDDEPDFYQTVHPPPQRQQAQEEPRVIPEEQPKVQENIKETAAPKPQESISKGNPTIQQSNTVDLGQIQEPVDDNRNQRSMSAPPENRSSGKRYVSSFTIPNLNSGISGDMGARMSQPDSAAPPQQQQYSQPQNRPNERIIPIHIEGRDEPVIPKNIQTNFQQPPQPASEKIFGHRPSEFTKFLNPQNLAQEDLHRQQQQQEEQYQKQQQEYQQRQQQNYQKQQDELHHQQQQQQSEPEHTTSVPQKPSPLETIQSIQKDVSALMSQVGTFAGMPRDKQYLYLDEMLTRNLLKLDDVETEGKDTIRQARKEAIKCIEECIRILESKANANELNRKKLADVASVEISADKMEFENKNVENQPTELVVGGISKSGTAASILTGENKIEAPMEVADTVATSSSTTDKVEDNVIQETNAKDESADTDKNVVAAGGDNMDANPSNINEEKLASESQEQSSQDDKNKSDKSEKKKVKKKVEKK